MPAADGKLTASELAAIYALVQAQAAIREQLTRMAVTAALAPLRAVNWWSPADVAYAVDQLLRVVQPVQLRMAQVTDAAMARTLTTMTGRPVRPIGAVDIRQLRRVTSPAVARLVSSRPPVEIGPDGDLDLDAVFEQEDEQERRRRDEEDDRRAQELADEIEREIQDEADRRERELGDGLDPDFGDDLPQLRALDPMEPYIRIGSEYRYLVTKGTPEPEAAQRAADRVAEVAEQDISLAQRAQEHAVLRQTDPDEIRGWRRILRPELGQGGPPCGLCVIAADRIYKREELKPIHLRCRCAVLPIRGVADPGLRLNVEDLDRIYQAAGGTGGRKLKKLRVAITEHGEIGPILLPYGKGYRDAEEAVADRRDGATRRRLAGLERSTTALERKLAAGETRLRPLVGYQQRLIEQLREELAAA